MFLCVIFVVEPLVAFARLRVDAVADNDGGTTMSVADELEIEREGERRGGKCPRISSGREAGPL